jgi:predicted DNA-binding protein (MmcQ/YjbR family)
MTPKQIHDYCATLRGAALDHPFGPDTNVWKVGGKMFAIFTDGGPGVSLKCRDPHTAALLIKVGKATQAPYLKRGAWVMLPWTLDAAEMHERLTVSYEIVLAAVPRSIRLGL